MPTQRDLVEIIPFPPGGSPSSASYQRQRQMPLLEAGTSTPESVAPVVSVISPTPGTAIDPVAAITIDVTDNKGLFRRILLTMRFAGLDIEEVVHNGDAFGPKYLGGLNNRIAIEGGYRYTLLRRGGWPANPTLVPYAIDVAGNENS
jgi:hypothetical protein